LVRLIVAVGKQIGARETARLERFKPNLLNEAKVYVNRSPFHNPQASALPFSVVTNNFVVLNDNTADIEVGTTYGVIDNLRRAHCSSATPKKWLRRFVMYNEALGGISRLSFQMNAASLPHAKLMQAIEAIGTRVAPAVRERLATESNLNQAAMR